MLNTALEMLEAPLDTAERGERPVTELTSELAWPAAPRGRSLDCCCMYCAKDDEGRCWLPLDTVVDTKLGFCAGFLLADVVLLRDLLRAWGAGGAVLILRLRLVERDRLLVGDGVFGCLALLGVFFGDLLFLGDGLALRDVEEEL